MRTALLFRQTSGQSWLATTALHSSNELGELAQWLHHDDTVVYVTVVVIIIISNTHPRRCSLHYSTVWKFVRCQMLYAINTLAQTTVQQSTRNKKQPQTLTRCDTSSTACLRLFPFHHDLELWPFTPKYNTFLYPIMHHWWQHKFDENPSNIFYV